MAEYLVPSDSDSRTEYKVTTQTTQSGVIATRCTCPAGKQMRDCKHKKRVQANPANYREVGKPFTPPQLRKDYGVVNDVVDAEVVKPLPMLAKDLTPKVKITPGRYTAEPKYDGIRMFAEVVRPGVIRTWSRLGNDCNHRLSAQLTVSIGQLPVGLYDGELVIPEDGTYSSDVTTKTNVNKLHYVVFDALRLLDTDITKQPQRTRRMHLELIFSKLTLQGVALSPSHELLSREHLDEIVGEIWERSGEGVIVKDVEAAYTPGKRTTAFLKLKEKGDAVLKIMGFAESKGEIMNRGYFAMTVLKDREGNWTVVKTKNDAEILKLETEATETPRVDQVIRIGARTVNYHSNHPAVGRDLRIEFQRRTPDGSYRHPRWYRMGAE